MAHNQSTGAKQQGGVGGNGDRSCTKTITGYGRGANGKGWGEPGGDGKESEDGE